MSTYAQKIKNSIKQKKKDLFKFHYFIMNQVYIY